MSWYIMSSYWMIRMVGAYWSVNYLARVCACERLSLSETLSYWTTRQERFARPWRIPKRTLYYNLTNILVDLFYCGDLICDFMCLKVLALPLKGLTVITILIVLDLTSFYFITIILFTLLHLQNYYLFPSSY